MSHVINSTQPGTGPGGSAKITIEYTPAHTVPPAQQIRKFQKAERKAQEINEFLYGDGADPYPDE